MGLAMMGTGVAEGQDRAVEAARRAISSPLLEGASVNGARGVIINMTGGPDLSLVEVSDASTIVQEAADEDANIIFGAVVDPALKGKVKITGDRDRLRRCRRPRARRRCGADAGRHDAITPSTRAAARRRCLPRHRRPASRLSIARRPLLDLPIAARLPASASSVPAAGGGLRRPGRRGRRRHAARRRRGGRLAADPDFAAARRSTCRRSCGARKADSGEAGGAGRAGRAGRASWSATVARQSVGDGLQTVREERSKDRSLPEVPSRMWLPWVYARRPAFPVVE